MDSFEEMALRAVADAGWRLPKDVAVAIATRIRDELCKGQEPVAYENWSDEEQEWTLTRRRNKFAKQRSLYLHPAPIPADMALVSRTVNEQVRCVLTTPGNYRTYQDQWTALIAAYEKEAKK